MCATKTIDLVEFDYSVRFFSGKQHGRFNLIRLSFRPCILILSSCTGPSFSSPPSPSQSFIWKPGGNPDQGPHGRCPLRRVSVNPF